MQVVIAIMMKLGEGDHNLPKSSPRRERHNARRRANGPHPTAADFVGV